MIYLYDKESGRFLGYMDSSDNVQVELNKKNFLWSEVAGGDAYYFHDGEPIKRPSCQAHLDGLVLKSVPIGSKIIIDGETYTADSENVTLNFPFAGTYHVTLVPPFPYLEKEFEIDYQP